MLTPSLSLGDDDASWDLVRALDWLAAALLGALVVTAMGGAVAAVWSRAGGGSTLSLDLPVYLRIESAVEWASPFSGVLLLAALGLSTAPRLIWSQQPARASDVRLGRILLWISLLGGVTAIAALVGVATEAWYLSGSGVIEFAPLAASATATVILSGAACGLSVVADRSELFEEGEDLGPEPEVEPSSDPDPGGSVPM